jgi:GDP-L-fucose synthase
MEKDSRIYVAGHTGLVGSAIVRRLTRGGYRNLILATSQELDLRRQADVEQFFQHEHPAHVFLAAARVGGILANNTYRADFIYDNIAIATNVIQAAHRWGVQKLLNLGSSCIYTKYAPQPLKEEYLLSGALEPTNEPYAIAKISAIKLCRYFNEQYGTNFLSVMPTNLYGPQDNFNLETAHVLPALMRKFYLGKLLARKSEDLIRQDLDRFPLGFESGGTSSRRDIEGLLEKAGIRAEDVLLWGTGSPFREFLYVDDLADAVVFLMERYGYADIGELINVGTGSDRRIADLALLVRGIVGFRGGIRYDPSKPDGTPRKLLDVSKLTRLGWKSATTLEEGLRLTFAWYTS